MGMAAHHLVGYRVGHVVIIEKPQFAGHLRVEHHLEQQIAQFVLQALHVVLGDRVGDLVGFLDGVGGDGPEILLHVPRAAALGITQFRHDLQQAFGFVSHPVQGFSAGVAMMGRRRRT